MADRSIVVRLRAEVDGFKREMAEATKAVDQTAKGTETAAKQADTAMGRMVQSAQKNRAAWDTVGTTLTGFGAAALGGLALATKAAMDWESAWAGVQKTVDGTAPQMAALEQGLRGMARELPASHQEIAAVAEAAGQLGIATPNILSFTRTMIDLGESTNMSADQAATALARFMNITQTSQQDVGRLGASVVGLGNNFATTESEIVDMSMRLAGAGAQAKLSEGEILGMAAAMSSVGIEAEAGGTAMSQTMKRIGKAVDEGGDSLDLFAQISGMSSEQFATAWETRPAEALNAFVEGLSRTEQMGMSTNAVLTELGITGIRESDALLRLSSATGVLSDAMAMGNEEFDKGTALIEEASKRYETAESRIAMAKNALVDSAISIGGVVLPAFADLADGVADAAGWFAELPAPVHQAAAGLGAIVGAGSLAAGSFLLLFPRVMDTVSAFKTLKTDMPGVAGALGKVGKAAGVASLALVGIGIVDGFRRSFIEAGIGADEYTAALINLAETSDITRGSFDKLYAETLPSSFEVVNDFGSALRELDADGFTKFADELSTGFGVFGNSVRDDLLASMEQVDRAMVSFAQGGSLENVVEQFNAATESAEAYGYSAEDVLNQLPGLRTELTNIATNAGLAADDQTLLRIATGELVPVVDETTGAVEGYSDAVAGAAEETESAADAVAELQEKMFSLADGFLNARKAARDYEDSLKEAKEVLDENGKAWGTNTEKARENGEALDGVAQSVLDNAEAMKRNGEDVGGYLESQREILWNLARDFGATEEEATAYVDALGLVPEEIQTLIELEDEAAREQWNTLWTDLGSHPPLVIDPEVDPEGKVSQFSGLVSDIPPEKNTDIGVETEEAIQKTYGFGDVLEGETQDQTTTITADTEFAMWEVNALTEAIGNAGGTVEINGSTVTAEQALSFLQGTINESDGTVTINGRTVPADEALHTLVGVVNTTDGTIDVFADTDSAESAANRAARDRDSTIDVDATTGGAESSINQTARNRSSNVNQTASTGSAESSLNRTARNRTSTITVRYSRPGFSGAGGSSGFATGGPVHGPGTGTSDSIQALLSNGEHILTAAEVALAGGHDSIFRMRAAIRAGALRFADGGGVESGGYASVPVMAPAMPGTRSITAAVDSGAIFNATKAGVLAGFAEADITATVSDRVSSALYQRGKSVSRGLGAGW